MRAVVVAVLVLVTVLSGTTACSSSGSSSPPTAPTVAAATALLAANAAAVRGRHTAAFDTTLDPSRAAASFRATQRTDFANLADVPLAQWSYTVLGTIADAAAARRARARYGAPVLLLHISLDYRLRDIDTVASSHDQYLVMTSRDGRSYLAGDDALGASSPSWRGPWTYGPLAVAHGAVSLVLGPPGDGRLLRSLAMQADAAVRAVTAVWGTTWAGRVAVLVPATGAEFAALTGSGIKDVSAAAVSDGIDAVSDRPAGQRLVLNPGQLDNLTPLGRGIVLRHEITHIASAADTADITPRWLVEGFADYVANLGTGQSVATAASELRAQVRAGSLPTTLPTDAAFAAARAETYEQSWLACRLIAQRVGRAGLLRFYRAVGTALEPKAPALEHAFARVLGETQAAFVVQWRAYLRRVLA